METLENITYKSIGNSIAQAPPLIQEQIFKNSKEYYEKSMKKIIKEETRNDVMEELLEEYLNLIPEYMDEAGDLLIKYSEIKSEGDLKRSMKNNNYFRDIHEEIINLVAHSSFQHYIKLKEHFSKKFYY